MQILKKKEGAWEFLKYFLTQEYYERQMEAGADHMYFPSRKDMYEVLCEELMQTEAITDEAGAEQTVGKYEYYGGFSKMGREPLTEEEKEAVTQLIEGASYGNGVNYEIRKIIEEETAPYFLGQKSADEVAKIIQSRAQTFVNENR